MVVDLDQAILVALALQLRTEIVRGILPNREVESIAIELHSSVEIHTADHAVIR